jgi:aldose 1-epimerase
MIQKMDFGTMADGSRVDLFVLTNANQSVVKLTNYGARVTELHVPDRGGVLGNVTLGFGNLKQYLEPEPCLGTTVGRVANRIANAEFTLDGVRYHLSRNDGPNTLHGGPKAWDKRVWNAHPVERPDGPGIDFSYLSPDTDDGFPGTVRVSVHFTWTDRNELRIEYEAATDRATPINLTNHSYFNLAGPGNGTVYDHVLTIYGDKYTPVNEQLLSTGKIEPVHGTPLDFTRPTAIGARIHQVGVGYDHNYVLDEKNGSLARAAEVKEPVTGRAMEVFTDQPAVQFYSGNYLDGSLKGIGGAYIKHGGFCLETQHFPDSVHHGNFPNTILRPGEIFRSTTIYRFKAG